MSGWPLALGRPVGGHSAASRWPLSGQFEPFKRGTDTTPEGLGLGLATVTRLVTRHRGACGVRSAVGHGSVFWFELPLASTAPAES